MVGLDATERARLHIKQGKALHAKLEGIKNSPRDEVLCRTCRDKVQERLKKRRGYEGGVTR